PVGSRGTALGGNFIASISGVEAMHWNPAGVAASPYRAELMASHFRYIADINVEYAAVAAKFNGVGSFGLNIRTLDFGDIPVTTELATEGTGELFSPTFVTVGLTFSRQMTDRIFFGTTAKIITEGILDQSASGVAFDFGLQYSTGVGGLKIGIALKNLGPNMKFDGSETETRVAPAGTEPGTRARNLRQPLATFELPSTLELGLSYDIGVSDKAKVTVAGNFMNNNFGLDQYGLAGEFNFDKKIFLRGGYTLAYNPDNEKFLGSEEEFLFGPSAGAGVALDIGSFNVLLDYAYRATEFFDSNQWFTLTLGF
ncbi:MAG: PorV/PorQ family protein, partial [bacterium]